MALITREEWGARPPRNVSHNISPISATGHWGGPSPWRGKNFTDHSQCYAIVRAWQNFHMDTRGWSDIAYNGMPCPHGDVFQGRWLRVRSAANGTNSGNFNSYALCYIGGEGDPLTVAGKKAFMDGARWLQVPLRHVHSDWKATGCPGDEIRNWIRSGGALPPAQKPQPPVQKPAPPEPEQPAIEETITGVDMYIAVHGVGFFAQTGNVTIPLVGLDLAGFGLLTKQASCPVQIIPPGAAADWVNKTMLQTAKATGA